MPTQDEVLEALSQIIDPDFRKDIVSLGFVKNMQIDKGCVAFDIELTTPACPVKDRFREQAQSVVGALHDVDEVRVNMTARPQKKNPLVENSRLHTVSQIVAISSCKGGVGKSTVAAGVARTLANRGHRVGLLDADIYGPSLPTLFNLHGHELKGTQDNIILPAESDGLKLLSFGFLAGDQPAVMRGPIISNYMTQLLHGVDWGDLEYLIIDMPPGTGDIQITIAQSVQLDGAVIVTTPQALALADVGKGIVMFDKVNVPILGVIENMAYFEADGKRYHPFGTGGAQMLEERFGVEALGELPLAPEDYAVHYDKKYRNAATDTVVDEMIMSLGKSSVAQDSKPVVSFGPRRIELKWPDGETTTVSNYLLRINSRDARSVNEMTGEQIIKPESISKDIMPMEVKTIGNYAIKVVWNDGHDTALYSYKLIRDLAAQEADAPPTT